MPRVINIVLLTGICCCLAGIAGCSSFVPPPNLPSSAAANSGSRKTLGGDLYVADSSDDVINVYAPGSPNRVRRIGDMQVAALAFDRGGNLYAVTVFHNSTWVHVFQPGASRIWYTIQKGLNYYGGSIVGSPAGGAAVTSIDFLRRSDGWISVYASGSKTPQSTCCTGIKRPQNIAFDDAGNLFVEARSTSGASFISVYAPGASQPFRTITQGLANAGPIVVGRNDNLYVAISGSGSSSIAVYHSGVGHPSYSIANGVRSPVALAIDGAGDIFVANGDGTIAAYKPGATSPAWTIPAKKGSNVTALTVDSSDTLYVLYSHNVMVYRQGRQLWYTISQSSSTSFAVAPR